jgi:hypothetical protein
MKEMKKKLESNSHIAQTPPTRKRIETTEKIIQHMTKITHFLIFICMKMFKDHKEDTLTEDEVNCTLEMFEELWFNLAKNTIESDEKNTWKEVVHNMLKFAPESRTSYGFLSNMEERFHLCCCFLYYWIEKTQSSVKLSDSIDSNKSNLFTLTEVINKHIYHSNCEAIYIKVKEKFAKMIRKRKKLGTQTKQ